MSRRIAVAHAFAAAFTVALGAAAPAAAVPFSALVGFDAFFLYNQAALGEFRDRVETRGPLNETRVASFGDRPGTEVRVTGVARGRTPAGRPVELGIDVAAETVTGQSSFGVPANISAAFYDGVLFAYPVTASQVPSNLTFNFVTRVDADIAVNVFNPFTGQVGPAGPGATGNVGVEVFSTINRSSRDFGIQRSLGLDADTVLNGPFRTYTNEPVTVSISAAQLPDYVDLSTGQPTTLAAIRAAFDAAIRQCRITNLCSIGPGRSPLFQIDAFGVGLAFGGSMRAELMAESRISALNSLTLDGIYATDEQGQVVRGWIAGLSGQNYTLPQFRPEGPDLFFGDLGTPVPIPLPAPALMLLSALACLGGLRLRRRRSL